MTKVAGMISKIQWPGRRHLLSKPQRAKESGRLVISRTQRRAELTFNSHIFLLDIYPVRC